MDRSVGPSVYRLVGRSVGGSIGQLVGGLLVRAFVRPFRRHWQIRFEKPFHLLRKLSFRDLRRKGKQVNKDFCGLEFWPKVIFTKVSLHCIRNLIHKFLTGK